jgi:hypothetical protein
LKEKEKHFLQYRPSSRNKTKSQDSDEDPGMHLKKHSKHSKKSHKREKTLLLEIFRKKELYCWKFLEKKNKINL